LGRRILVAALLTLEALSSYGADSNTVAKVIYVGTYGDGRLFVALDAQINEPGCVNSRFDVSAGHPQIKTWLAVALTAAASAKTVVVRTNGCFGVLPTMTQTTDSWFYLQPN